MTGTNDNRAAFQQMLADCEINSKWEIVLVYALDRFGRNATEVAVKKQRSQRNGKTLISATQRTSVNIYGTRIDANKTGARIVQTAYLLRGKLKCGYCGQLISAESGTSLTKENKFYYKCHGRKKTQNGCTKATIKKELLEEFVVEFILGELKRK